MNGDAVINNIYTNNYSYEAKRLQQQIQYHTDLSQTIRWKFFQEMEIFSEEWKLLPALKIKFRSCSTITMSRPRHKYNKLRGHEHET